MGTTLLTIVISPLLSAWPVAANEDAEGPGIAGAPSLRTRRRDGTAAEDVASTDLAALGGRGGRHFEQTTTQRRRVDRAGEGEAPFLTKAKATEGDVLGKRHQRGGGGDE